MQESRGRVEVAGFKGVGCLEEMKKKGKWYDCSKMLHDNSDLIGLVYFDMDLR